MKTPPGPRSAPFVGDLFRIRRNPLAFFRQMQAEYGDLVHLRIAGQRLYLFSDPDMIRDVLVTHNRNFMKSRGLELAKRLLGNGLLTSDGEFHTRQRRLVQPAFHRDRVAGYAGVMSDYAHRACTRWQDGEQLNISDEMMRLTLAIVAKTLFDADVEAEAREIGESLTAAMALFRRVTNPFATFLEKLPLPSNRRFNQARARLDRTVYRLIDEHRRSGDRGDLLSMLLQAQDTEGDGSGMTDLQVRDEAMTIFLAGHETTSNALSWTWYLLAQHSDAERRMHAEIDSVLGDRLPGVDDVERLPYTHSVLAESMRLFPPAWIIGRKALAGYPVGPYVLGAGSVVLMSQYVVHHDPRFYPDPDRFDPDRWLPELRETRPKFSYFPFGGGPRVCIGESFAWMEGVLLLATIARRYALRLAPGAMAVPEPLITLRPKGGIQMRVLER